jgi:membrane fusion protein, adhesin transport system
MSRSNPPPRFTGIYLLLLLILFAAWAAWFDIDQMVRAQGQVIPQDKTQVIQAADGGVIKELRVSEGEAVKKGQVLAVLESDRARAGVEEITNRIAGFQISRIRAQAEAMGTAPKFAHFNKSHPDLVSSQQALYWQNQTALRKDTEALTEQVRLALSEFELTQRLHDNGDVSRIELMRTQRGLIDARQKLHAVQEKYKTDARRELAKIEEEVTSQRSKLQERASVLDHTEIQASLDGVVKSLRINTLGGVLRNGDELMQISPTTGGYIIESRINPADIGQLQLGMPVTVRLDAFDFSLYGSLEGKLTYLSSDTLTEQGPDGKYQTYYRAKVDLLAQDKASRIQLSDIKAGMTATLDIKTGRRTVLEFILKPISRAFEGALGQR